MSANISEKVTSVLFIFFLCTSLIPSTAFAGTTTSSPTGDDENGDVRAQTALNQLSQEEETILHNVGEPIDSGIDTSPELNQLRFTDFTIEKNEEATVRVSATIKGELPENKLPIVHPVSVEFSEDGEELGNQRVFLGPDTSPEFENRFIVENEVTFTARFVQDEDTDRTIELSAQGVLDPSAQTQIGRDISVIGSSQSQSFNSDAKITRVDVDRPISDNTFVSRFKASDENTQAQYLEDYNIPTSKGAVGTVRNFEEMRNSGSNATRFSDIASELVIGTSTRGLSEGGTQTFVIAYRAQTNTDVSVTPVDTDGRPIHPGRSDTYTLPADPTDSAKCQEGDAFDLCVFVLSDIERDLINLNREMYVEYASSGDDVELDVFCQATVTGAYDDSMTSCGYTDTVDSIKDVGIFDFTGKGSTADDSEWRSGLVTITPGDTVDLNATVQNFGTVGFSGEVRFFVREDTTQVPESVSTTSVSQTNTFGFASTVTKSNVRLVLDGVSFDENSLSTIGLRAEGVGDEFEFRDITESDIDDSGAITIQSWDSENILSNEYTVTLPDIEDISIDELSLESVPTELETERVASVSLSGNSAVDVIEEGLPANFNADGVTYVALLCSEERASECTLTDNEDIAELRVVFDGFERDTEPPDIRSDFYFLSLPVTGFETIQKGQEVRLSPFRPNGDGWVEGSTTSVESETTVLDTVRVESIYRNDPSRFGEQRAQAEDQLPDEASWEFIEADFVRVDSEVVFSDTRPNGDGWELTSETPIYETRTGESATRWSSTEITDEDFAAGWRRVFSDEGNLETRTQEVVTETRFALENPGICTGCFTYESIEQFETRTGESVDESRATAWRDTGQLQEIALREVDGEFDTFPVVEDREPTSVWRRILYTLTDPLLTTYRRAVYETLEVTQWERVGVETQFLQENEELAEVYKWERVLYDGLYTYSTTVDAGTEVTEWERQLEETQANEWGQEQVWFDLSDSFDRPVTPEGVATGINTVEWTFASGVTLQSPWLESIHGDSSTSPEDRECPTGYQNEDGIVLISSDTGAIMYESCSDTTGAGADIILRVGLVADGNKINDDSTEISPQVTLTDRALNSETKDLSVFVVKENARSSDRGEILTQPTINAVEPVVDKIDYRNGFVEFEVTIQADEDDLGHPWELAVIPGDESTGSCPAGYSTHIEEVLSITDTSVTILREETTCQTEGIWNIEGIPIPLDHTLPTDADSTPDEYPAGSVRECPAGYLSGQMINEDGELVITCTAPGEDEFVLGTLSDDGVTQFESIPREAVDGCPVGYSVVDFEGSDLICELSSITSVPLQYQDTTLRYQSVSEDVVSQSGSIQCPAGVYTQVIRDGQVVCLYVGSGDDNEMVSGTSRPAEFEVNRGGAYPAGSIRQCEEVGFTTQLSELGEDIICISPDSEGFFTLATATTADPVRLSEPIDFDRDVTAQKTVWSSSAIAGGVEQIRVTINPRRNGAIQPTGDEDMFDFEFVLQPKVTTTEDSLSSTALPRITETGSVHLCMASSTAVLPKTTKGEFECADFDSDFNGIADFDSTAAINAQTEPLQNYLHDACPYNPKYPDITGAGLTVSEFIDKIQRGEFTEDELRSFYGPGSDPCTFEGTNIEPLSEQNILTSGTLPDVISTQLTQQIASNNADSDHILDTAIAGCESTEQECVTLFTTTIQPSLDGSDIEPGVERRLAYLLTRTEWENNWWWDDDLTELFVRDTVDVSYVGIESQAIGGFRVHQFEWNLEETPGIIGTSYSWLDYDSSEPFTLNYRNPYSNPDISEVIRRPNSHSNDGALTLEYSMLPDAQVNEGLIAYYPFSEGPSYNPGTQSGTTESPIVYDVWGGGNTGVGIYNGFHWIVEEKYVDSYEDWLSAHPQKFTFNVDREIEYEAWNPYYLDENLILHERFPTAIPRQRNCIFGCSWDELDELPDLPASVLNDGGVRDNSGVFGGKSYAFEGNTWVELSGNFHEFRFEEPRGDRDFGSLTQYYLTEDGSGSDTIPDTSLAEELAGESYTVSFYMRQTPLSEVSDFGENTLLNIHQTGTNNAQMHWYSMSVTESSVCVDSEEIQCFPADGIGWTNKIYKEYEIFKGAEPYKTDDFLLSSRLPTRGDWTQVTIVSVARGDRSTAIPSSGTGVEVYINGLLKDVIREGDSGFRASDGGVNDDSRIALGVLWRETQIGNTLSDHGWDEYPSNILEGVEMAELRIYDEPKRGAFINEELYRTSGEWTSQPVRVADEGAEYLRTSEVPNIQFNPSSEGTLGHDETAALQLEVIPCNSDGCFEDGKQVYRTIYSRSIFGATTMEHRVYDDSIVADGTSLTIQDSVGTARVIRVQDRPLRGLETPNLEIPESGITHFKYHVKMETDSVSFTPSLKYISTTVPVFSAFETCQDALITDPGRWGVDTFLGLTFTDSDGELFWVSDCDMTTQGGGWTKFWWHDTLESSDEGTIPSGGLFSQDIWECNAEVDATCLGRIPTQIGASNSGLPEDDLRLLVKATTADNEEIWAAWDLTDEDSRTARDAYQAMTAETRFSFNNPENVCWNAYHYDRRYASFGQSDVDCKDRFGSTTNSFGLSTSGISRVTDPTSEAFEVIRQADGSLTLRAFGRGDIVELELYFRHGGPTANPG